MTEASTLGQVMPGVICPLAVRRVAGIKSGPLRAPTTGKGSKRRDAEGWNKEREGEVDAGWEVSCLFELSLSGTLSIFGTSP